MIIIRISGGLGNQMFQYALGRALAIKNNTDLFLDLSGLVTKPGEAPRHFSLDIFNTKYKVATKDDFVALGIANPAGQTLPLRAKRYIKRAVESLLPLEKRKVIIEPRFSFVPEIARLSDNHYLSGVWQSEKYFKSVEKELRNDFTFKEKITGDFANIAKMIQNSDSVCINVRRADYVTDPKIRSKLGFVGKKYYENAVSFMQKRSSDARFFVFSDDMDWCKENLDFIPNVFFVSHEHAGKSFGNYLQLMSLSRHYIIPNSTFAWWAVWLNVNPGKIVTAPKKWFASDLDDSDLVQSDWIRM